MINKTEFLKIVGRYYNAVTHVNALADKWNENNSDKELKLVPIIEISTYGNVSFNKNSAPFISAQLNLEFNENMCSENVFCLITESYWRSKGKDFNELKGDELVDAAIRWIDKIEQTFIECIEGTSKEYSIDKTLRAIELKKELKSLNSQTRIQYET